MNQCIRLALSLQAFANLRPVNEMKRATVGLISILGNIRSVEFFIYSLLNFNFSNVYLTFSRVWVITWIWEVDF